jgi:hypothetical protein
LFQSINIFSWTSTRHPTIAIEKTKINKFYPLFPHSMKTGITRWWKNNTMHTRLEDTSRWRGESRSQHVEDSYSWDESEAGRVLFLEITGFQHIQLLQLYFPQTISQLHFYKLLWVPLVTSISILQHNNLHMLFAAPMVSVPDPLPVSHGLQYIV